MDQETFSSPYVH